MELDFGTHEDLNKSQVKAHIRKIKGKLVNVQSYSNKRTKKVAVATFTAPSVTIAPFRTGTKSQVILDFLLAGNHSKLEILDELVKQFGGTPQSNMNSLNLFLSDFQKPAGTYSASRGVSIVPNASGKLELGDDVDVNAVPVKRTGGTPTPKKDYTPPPLPPGYSLRKRWEIWTKVEELQDMDKAAVFHELARIKPNFDSSHIKAKAYAELVILETIFTKQDLTTYYYGKKKTGIYLADVQKPADRQAPNYSEVQKLFADFPMLESDVKTRLHDAWHHGINPNKKVWSRHSSPFVFDKIDIYNNLSRGEGFQAYGVGLYSETNDGVYSTYQSSFRNRAPIMIDGEPVEVSAIIKEIIEKYSGNLDAYIYDKVYGVSNKVNAGASIIREAAKSVLLPHGFIAAYQPAGNDLRFSKPEASLRINLSGSGSGGSNFKGKVVSVLSSDQANLLSFIADDATLNPGLMTDNSLANLKAYRKDHRQGSWEYSADDALDLFNDLQGYLDKVDLPDKVYLYKAQYNKDWADASKGKWESRTFDYMPTLRPPVHIKVSNQFSTMDSEVHYRYYGPTADALVWNPKSVQLIHTYNQSKYQELTAFTDALVKSGAAQDTIDTQVERFVKDTYLDYMANVYPKLVPIKNKTAVAGPVDPAAKEAELRKKLTPDLANAKDVMARVANKPKTAITYEFKTANRDLYLDYNKDLDQQHPYVRERIMLIAEHLNDHIPGHSHNGISRIDTGQEIYQKLGRMLEKYAKPHSKTNSNIGQEVASKLLDTIGIPGNKFIDGNSRSGQANPSYNYVTYGDRHIQIITRKSMAEPLLLIKSTQDPDTWAEPIKLEFQGLTCMIENKKGTVRSGVNKDGEKWSTKLFYPYGYIEGTKGADGDEVDCYIGSNPHAAMAYVVHQQNPTTKEYDEDKVMLGFDSPEHARDAYLAHYDDQTFMKHITAMPMHEFVLLLKEKGKKGIKLTKSYVEQCTEAIQKAINMGKLVKKVITDKNGKRQTKWVNPEMKTPQSKSAKPKTSAPKSSSEGQSSSNTGKTPSSSSTSKKAETRNFKEIPEEEAMAQATWAEISSQMHKNLGEISKKELQHKPLEGNVNEANAGHIADTMRDEISKYVSYLAGDTTDLMHRLTNLVEKVIGDDDAFKDVSAQDMQLLGMDIVRKLVHQEAESNRQTFTDHGIRHIVGNILYQNEMLGELGKQGVEITPRDRLMAIFVQVNHDVGYTVPFVREGGQFGLDATKMHPQFSEKIAREQKGLWNEDHIFNAQEYDHAMSIIRQHSKSSLDVSDPILLTTQIADNTSLFSKEKLPPLFHKVPEGRELLTKMGVAAAAKDNAQFDMYRDQLHDAIDKCSFSPNLKRDLKAAIGNMNYLTPKFTLGIMAGEIHKVGRSADAMIEVRVKYNEFDSFLQEMFDMGQGQTKKLLADYGVTDYNQTEYKLGEHEGKAVFKIVIDGYDKKEA
jgi:hypothetical protein